MGPSAFLWKISAKIHIKADKLLSPRETRVARYMFQKVFTSITMFLNLAGMLLLYLTSRLHQKKVLSFAMILKQGWLRNVDEGRLKGTVASLHDL